MKSCFLTLIGILLTFTSFSQTTEKYNSEYANFYRAEELFQKEQFAAARIEFIEFIKHFRGNLNDPQLIKAYYYEGISALELFNNDAIPLLEDFNLRYPESIYKHVIFFKIGNFYYQKKDFKEALVWWTKMKSVDVDKENRSEYWFKLGYAHFQEAQFPEARNALFEVKEDSSQYAAPALYYFSHIAYNDKSYQVALDGFLKLKPHERFSKVVPYYIVQIYYLQGRYDEVTAYAPSIMDSSNVVNQTDLNHIIGDAYYRTGNYKEAVPYLEAYNAKSNTSRTEDYQLGYAHYKSGSFPKAIKLFDKVVRTKDSLAQVAYYQMGDAYLKLSNSLSARAAFEEASKIDKDLALQEDALYNYTVLSYKLDINPFDEAVVALEDFLTKFPNSKRISDVNQYLVNVYTSTNNYDKALASLDKIKNKDNTLKTAYQLVAFNRGVEVFQKGKYADAIKYFEMVDRYPVDPVISAKALFWTGEAQFRQQETDKSIKSFKSFLGMPGATASGLKPDAYYNMGYAYMKKDDVPQAIEAFRIYCQTPVTNKNKLADAYMRAGNGYYMTTQNENAIKQYNEALKLKSGFEDQALFYMAKSYGYSSQEDQKINHLVQLLTNYKNSKYIPQAMYEVAHSYKFKGDYDNAMRYFGGLVEDYPETDLVLDAKIELADIYYKKWEYAKAESAYRQLLLEYSEDKKVCEKIVRGLMMVYITLKQPEKASQLAVEYTCANVSTDEQESMFYSPAIEAYQDSLFNVAIPNFEKYLDRFPQGTFAPEARYYLAKSHLSTQSKDKAVQELNKLLEGQNSSYTEYAATYVAAHYYNNGQFNEAIPCYERIEKVTSKPSTLFNAKLGLMRCYVLTEQWQNAAVRAAEVLQNSQLNNTLRLEAEYAQGMANFNLGNFDKASPSLEWIVKNSTTALAAEAKYTIAEMYVKQNDLQKADATIRELVKMKPSYNYWVAKALLLQTRVLMLQKDYVQAEQTLNSILDHYPDQEDGILSDANELKNELNQLKAVPKRVENEQETVIEVNEQ